MFFKKENIDNNQQNNEYKNTNEKIISLSILDIDIFNIEKTVTLINNSKIDSVHYDVMDGTFVKNISFGNMFLSQLITKLKKPVDVHLMVNDPELQSYLYQNFCKVIYCHFETLYYREIISCLQRIKTQKLKVGLAIKPKTNVEQIYEYIEYCDEILVMTVEPGKGGQSFIENSVYKIKKLFDYINKNNLKTIISVDGGINNKVIKKCYDAGASKFIAGNYLLNNNKGLSLDNAIKTLRK